MAKTLISLTLLALTLTGCTEGVPTKLVAPSERVYTVSEFLAQPELRRKFFALCSDDPGQSERDPNCINVLSAERIASAGTTIPPIVP